MHFPCFIQQTLIEHLLCTRPCSRLWRHSSEWNRQNSLALRKLETETEKKQQHQKKKKKKEKERSYSYDYNSGKSNQAM